MLVLSLLDHQVAEALKAGKVGVIPTDTVYGLVCLAGNTAAVDRLYKLKNRHKKPGTIIAASVEQLTELGIKLRYLKAVSQFWPGAVSVVLPDDSDHAYLDMGQRTLAVRVPADQHLRQLLVLTGPLLTTSANVSGQPTAMTLQAAQDYFGNTVDFYVEGPDLTGRMPSTIIRVVDDAIEIVREGAVKVNENGAIE